MVQRHARLFHAEFDGACAPPDKADMQTAKSQAVAGLVAAWLGAAPIAGPMAGPAAAQTVPLGPNPSECEIQAALVGTTGPDCPPLPVRRAAPEPLPAPAAEPAPAAPLSAQPSAQIAVPAPPAPVPPPAVQHRAAFRILFDFNSARIRPESRAVLDRVGAVMTAPAAGTARFRIVGHTDAIGSDAANRALSQRRANAVVAYLTKTHRIRPDRLEALGMGASEPLLPGDPKAAANRRVEIVNLGE